MPTTLKNGMYVTPPISNEYLTAGKPYKVKCVETLESMHEYYFEIFDDKNELVMAVLNISAHINNLNWKIVEL